MESSLPTRKALLSIELLETAGATLRTRRGGVRSRAGRIFANSPARLSCFWDEAVCTVDVPAFPSDPGVGWLELPFALAKFHHGFPLRVIRVTERPFIVLDMECPVRVGVCLDDSKLCRDRGKALVIALRSSFLEFVADALCKVDGDPRRMWRARHGRMGIGHDPVAAMEWLHAAGHASARDVGAVDAPCSIQLADPRLLVDIRQQLPDDGPEGRV